MLTPRDYRLAMDAQDACNLTGVVYEFSRIISEIRNEANKLGKGTDWVNNHPICVAFSDKIRHLTKSDDTDILFDAFRTCRERSNEKASQS